MDILSVVHLKKYYGEGDCQVKAVDDISFSVARGAFVAIVGSSGSGKTTLLQIIGGLEHPTSGTVFMEDTDIYQLDEEERTILRREGIGFVFQDFNLIPAISVYDNLVLPLELDDEEPDPQYFAEVIALLGLGEKLNAYPEQLSGGQKQRVAIARALLTKPELILADEPTGNLDSDNSEQVIRLLQESSKKFGQTILMITHNNDIAKLADVQIHIEDGKIQNQQESNDAKMD